MNKKEEERQQAILTVAHRDYEKGLNARAFFKISNREISEDLVQDTFIKTWTYLVKGGKIEIMKAFLYHVLNNLIVDQYRKHKTSSLDLLMEKGFEPVDTEAKIFSEILDGRKALLLIARLPKKYQRVMRMRYVQDLTLKEMSMITGKSKNTLAVQAFRGLELLKALHNTE
ncbi:MAG: RNA polymerase sigma factor [Candidatus Pacebacteria bacterium]|nr:RNA polymerase sigma factor [Candidatus Paceibacterota bacterium]